MAFPMKLMCQGGWGICPACSTDKIKMSRFFKLLWFQAAEYDLRQKWTGLRVHRNSLPQSIHTWSPLPRSRHGAYPVSQRSLPYASKVTAVHTITVGMCCLFRHNHYVLLPAFLRLVPVVMGSCSYWRVHVRLSPWPVCPFMANGRGSCSLHWLL